MNDEAQIEVHRVLPGGGPGTLTAEEANAILEVAYLSTAADDELAEEELVAFRGLVTALRALVGPAAGEGQPSDDEIDALLDGFAAKVEHTDPADRLTTLATVLARPIAKHAAYKVSFAMALCDLGANDDESDFDDDVVEALGLSDDEADELASQVYEAIGVDEDDEDDEDDEEDDEEEGPSA